MTERSRSLFLYRMAMAVSAASVMLLLLTLVEPQWIERLFDASPDGGDGGLERWLVGGGFLVASVCAAAVAWRQKRQLASLPSVN